MALGSNSIDQAEPPCTFSLQVLLVERDVQGLLHDLGHVLRRVLDSEDLRDVSDDERYVSFLGTDQLLG